MLNLSKFKIMPFMNRDWLDSCSGISLKQTPLLFACDGILPKGLYPPCLRMADRTLLAGYPRNMILHFSKKLFFHAQWPPEIISVKITLVLLILTGKLLNRRMSQVPAGGVAKSPSGYNPPPDSPRSPSSPSGPAPNGGTVSPTDPEAKKEEKNPDWV